MEYTTKPDGTLEIVDDMGSSVLLNAKQTKTLLRHLKSNWTITSLHPFKLISVTTKESVSND